MALALLVVALMLASALCAPAAAWAAGESGSVDLGVSVSKTVAAAGSGDAGSVDLGVQVGLDAVSAESSSDADGGSVDIGVDVAFLGYHEVSFVGIYLDDAGKVDASMGDAGRVSLGSQKVAHGEAATAPDGVDRSEYWADAWYAQDPTAPSAPAGLSPVALADAPVTGDAVFYCLWKKGYMVRLDANNGDAAERGGEVASPGYVMVERDEAFDRGEKEDAPAGVKYAAFPEATRPGYVFKGWYWPETIWESGHEVPKTDDTGRVALNEKDGPVVPGKDASGAFPEGEMGYVDIRGHNGDTLYAKWEPVLGVRVELENSCSEHRSALWFWPGRGYTLKAPAADLELEEGSVVSAPGEIGITVDHNPEPAYNTQYFSGWGYADAVKEGDAYQDDRLVDCEKIEGEDGTAAGYTYRLTDRAFTTYVDDELNWVDTSYTTVDEATGVRTTTWVPLAATAHIRVSAPFEVTFQKAGAGYDYEKGEGPVLPYSAGELEAGGWIQSLPQGFKNTSERAVYVSRVDCVNVGASAILPGGHGKKIFSLYDGAREPGTDAFPGTGAALPFGYSTAGNANVGTADFRDEESWIVLPVLAEGERWSKQLYYGLDLDAAGFDRAAIAMGDPDGDAGYVAKIANVKYTYSVVP